MNICQYHCYMYSLKVFWHCAILLMYHICPTQGATASHQGPAVTHRPPDDGSFLLHRWTPPRGQTMNCTRNAYIPCGSNGF